METRIFVCVHFAKLQLSPVDSYSSNQLAPSDGTSYISHKDSPSALRLRDVFPTFSWLLLQIDVIKHDEHFLAKNVKDSSN